MTAASSNRSMSQAFGALFGTVTTTATAISTSVNAAGNLFEELEQRSSSRLRSVGLEIALAEEEKQVRLVKESALRTSEFLLESARRLAVNPDLAATYTKVLANIEAKLAAKQQQHQIQSESTTA